VLKCASTSHSPSPEVEIDDKSKNLSLLKGFCKKKNSCMMQGPSCSIRKESSAEPLFSFLGTKDNLRNACFLFLNEKNNLKILSIVKRGNTGISNKSRSLRKKIVIWMRIVHGSLPRLRQWVAGLDPDLIPVAQRWCSSPTHYVCMYVCSSNVNVCGM
jgi:hypothetical protein